MFNFVQAVLKLFKAVPNLEGEKFPHGIYNLNNERNLANGFFITERAFKVCPCVAGKKFFNFMKTNFGYDIFELNQGFYKSFNTVANSTPQKLLANKLLHYFSTYGMENLGLFNSDSVYIPNDVLELPKDAKPTKITVIEAIDKEEIEARVNRLIQSGAALSQETINDLQTVMSFFDLDLNVDDVPNKEFMVLLCEKLNILPKTPAQFLRYMIYLTNASTLLIKDSETIEALRNAEVNFDDYFASYIEKNGLGKLASNFHRFKPLWLAFKSHSDYMRATINKMRKLADRFHKPVKPQLLEHLTSAETVDFDQLNRELAKVTTFKKISLATALLYRMNNPETIIYIIRNGKAFADDYRGELKFDAQKVLDAIIDSVAEDIKPNVQGKRIYIPERFHYAVPTSEKKFFGNIPYGSCYTFGKKSIVVGVHWFNVLDSTGYQIRIDLDLHLNSRKYDIGWQNDFRGQNFINAKEAKIIFSGDMTDAPINRGGATEAYFVGESLIGDNLVVNLNYYNITYDCDTGEKISVPFKLFLADVSQNRIQMRHLVNAHEVAFCVPNEIADGEMFLGYLMSDEFGTKKFCFFSRRMGDRIVARSTRLTWKIEGAMNTSSKSFLSLSELLERAGAVLSDVTKEDCDINLDPAEVTKDALLDLLIK